jgi:hypothetical protein
VLTSLAGLREAVSGGASHVPAEVLGLLDLARQRGLTFLVRVHLERAALAVNVLHDGQSILRVLAVHTTIGASQRDEAPATTLLHYSRPFRKGHAEHVAIETGFFQCSQPGNMQNASKRGLPSSKCIV